MLANVIFCDLMCLLLLCIDIIQIVKVFCNMLYNFSVKQRLLIQVESSRFDLPCLVSFIPYLALIMTSFYQKFELAQEVNYSATFPKSVRDELANLVSVPL